MISNSANDKVEFNDIFDLNIVTAIKLILENKVYHNDKVSSNNTKFSSFNKIRFNEEKVIDDIFNNMSDEEIKKNYFLKDLFFKCQDAYNCFKVNSPFIKRINKYKITLNELLSDDHLLLNKILKRVNENRSFLKKLPNNIYDLVDKNLRDIIDRFYCGRYDIINLCTIASYNKDNSTEYLINSIYDKSNISYYEFMDSSSLMYHITHMFGSDQLNKDAIKFLSNISNEKRIASKIALDDKYKICVYRFSKEIDFCKIKDYELLNKINNGICILSNHVYKYDSKINTALETASYNCNEAMHNILFQESINK